MTILPAVALNVAVAEPAGTVIADAGTGSRLLLLDRDTVVPSEGAGWFKVSVQVLVTPLAKLPGLQDSEVRITGVVKLTMAVCERPFQVAVSVAL